MSPTKGISTGLLRQLPDLAWVLAGTLLLCLPALWNGFPLVYSDTGAYLATAFEGKLPMARPTGYGLFIRFTAIGGNLWLPLLAQSGLFAVLLHRTIKVVLPSGKTWIWYGAAMAVVVGLTGIAWYASQLMPDIFTGLVVLGAFLLFFDGQMGLPGRGFVAAALYVFCFSHYSHAALLLVLVFGLAAFWAFQRMRGRSLPFAGVRIVWAAAPALLAILSFYYVNYSHGLGWRMTRSSHVFTMARLSETGLLAEYLHETCGYQPSSLCPYADSLPASAADFIWSEQSPFKKTGYWENSQPGYDSLLSDFFSRGHYLKGYLLASSEAGLAQLVALSVGEGVTPYNESSSPYKFFERKHPHQLPSFVASRQFAREFSFTWEKLALFLTMGLAVGVVLVVVALRWRRLGGLPSRFLILSVAGYVANAFLTGALANVYSRLQSRIAWVLPLAAMILLADWLLSRRKPG